MQPLDPYAPENQDPPAQTGSKKWIYIGAGVAALLALFYFTRDKK